MLLARKILSIFKMMNFRKTKFARFMNNRVPANQRYEPTEYEHAANCATHAFWIIPSILGSSILYGLSDDQWEMISAWIYGFGLSGLFIVSTVFHTISWKKSHFRMLSVTGLAARDHTPAGSEIHHCAGIGQSGHELNLSRTQQIKIPFIRNCRTMEHCFHMFDRMVIYFFIAASYAPWLNLRELGPWASHMRWIIWIMACIGTVYVFLFHERYKIVELICYMVMGIFPALVILSMPNTEGLFELLLGGVFYTMGMLFFKSDGRIPFAHAIWHLFVAIGAGIHYYAIWKYLYRPEMLDMRTSK
ncbi:monocyte to macrophage differentiation factor 2a isoform X2 [Mobula hypostoma]|uniref:monocyte to macrophage differentiation factor 2a isoform X2 n=1 Tax=Mobula hypostoma TaxID=723540 RepID=UPI002FC2B519